MNRIFLKKKKGLIDSLLKEDGKSEGIQILCLFGNYEADVSSSGRRDHGLTLIMCADQL